jgi:hypothetical protein
MVKWKNGKLKQIKARTIFIEWALAAPWIFAGFSL